MGESLQGEKRVTLWIVTVKLEKNPKHDPQNKKTGTCPFSHETCTDSTGEHHSFIYNAGIRETAHEIIGKFSGSYHVTRVEIA